MSNAKLPLSGLAALVTGGGSGIGLACAERLLRDGASVTIAGRTESRLRQATHELEPEAPAGAKVAFAVCDVSDEAQVEAAVARAASLGGKLAIAVASAGAAGFGPILSLPVESWRQAVDVNLIGTFLTVKHAGAAMRDAGGGSIVAISSIAGLLTHRFLAPYCATKAAIEMLVRCAADELGPQKIRVNAVRPGLVPTDMSLPLTEDRVITEDYLAQMPLKQLGKPEDVAEAVRYLAGPESAWVTGQIFGVDGGHSLRRGPNLDTMIERFGG
jgi:NAD(P)-dependent dehydrogenase (short-subunit alcohol dehydrogenase family)